MGVQGVVQQIENGVHEHSVLTFQAWALDQLRTLLRFDSASWSEITRHQEIEFNRILAYLLPQEAIDRYLTLRHECFDLSVLFETPNRTRTGDQFLRLDLYHKSEIYQKLWRLYQVEDVLITGIRNHHSLEHQGTVIALYSANRYRIYDEEDRRLAQLLVQKAETEWKTLLLMQERPSGVANLGAGVFHLDGRCRFIQASLKDYLTATFPGWGDRLPERLLKAINMGDRVPVVRGKVLFWLFRIGEYIAVQGMDIAALGLSDREAEIGYLYGVCRLQTGEVETKLGIDGKHTAVKKALEKIGKKAGFNGQGREAIAKRFGEIGVRGWV